MAYNPPIGSIYHLYTTYILPSGGLYNPYHRLGEPETTIDANPLFSKGVWDTPHLKGGWLDSSSDLSPAEVQQKRGAHVDDPAKTTQTIKLSTTDSSVEEES